MTKNKNLAAVLRNCADMSTPCGNCPYKETDGICIKMLLNDAAAAIEELQAQLPKRGKWIVHTEVKNIYGGICVECPVCGDHFVVLNVSDEKYCRSCGADMRDMEVQE